MTNPESLAYGSNYTREDSVLPPDTPAYHEIQKYNPDSIKAELIRLHNEIVVPDAPPPSMNRIEDVPEAIRNKPELLALLGIGGEPQVPPDPLTDFDADKNTLHTGMEGMTWVSHRFPRATDKMELFDYAVTKAQACEDPANGALLLSTAVLVIHPFEDGNGRVARAFYSDLMGAKRPDEANRAGNAGAARKYIDLGSVFSGEEMIEFVNNYSYTQRGMEYDSTSEIGLLDEIEEASIPTLLEGLGEEERSDLTDALGFEDPSTIDKPGLLFSSSLLMKNNPNLTELVEENQTTEKRLITIHSLLSASTLEEKKEFVAGLWDYRKLQAQAAIDFLSDDYGGEKTVNTLPGGAIKLRDFVLQKTTNLITSNMPQ